MSAPTSDLLGADVRLLCRYRSGVEGEMVRRGIHLTLDAITTGLRNSG